MMKFTAHTEDYAGNENTFTVEASNAHEAQVIAGRACNRIVEEKVVYLTKE